MNFKNLYADTLDNCINNGINFKIFNKKTHQGAGGWVTETEFVCCFKRPDFMEVFVHESCHVDQLLEKDSIWHDPDLAGDANIWDADWAAKHPRKALKAWKKTVELELDCETRALEKIKKYKLNLDANGYTQRANCYAASYFYFQKYNCFYDPQNTPYRDAEVFSVFPSDKLFTFDEAWRPRKELGEFIKQNNKLLS